MRLIKSLLFIAFLAWGWQAVCFADVLPLDQKNFVAERYYSGLDACEENRVAPLDDVRGGVVPHHLLAADIIADFFQKLSLNKSPRTIILLGPNHRELGDSPLLSSLSDWETPFGVCRADKNIIKRLRSKGVLTLDDPILANEHSVSILIPFIRKYFKKTRVVPIIVSSSLSRKNALHLGKTLSDFLGPETLLVASLDFSHYLSSRQAELKDGETIKSVYNWDYNEVANYGNDHVDSHAVLLALMKAMELQKARDISVLQHSNSGIIFEQEVDNSSSYFSIFYSKLRSENLVKISLCGDIMLARSVGRLMEGRGYTFPFQEAKFIFQHSSLVFGNLESVLSRDPFVYRKGLRFKASAEAVKGLKYAGFNYLGVENNHKMDYGMRTWKESKRLLNEHGITPVDSNAAVFYDHKGIKIGLIAFDTTTGRFNIKKAIDKIKQAKQKADVMILSMHWGAEYKKQQNSVQQEVAHKLIDNGADLIFGHHPHVLQGIEKYKQGYIFYSLGNFIFDQYFSVDVRRGLAINIYCNKKGISFIDLIPVKNYASQIRFTEPHLRKKMLMQLAEISDSPLRPQILSGRIGDSK